ncbi:hypothetical protein ACP4OV_012995 [Aristida adscensionis]
MALGSVATVPRWQEWAETGAPALGMGQNGSAAQHFMVGRRRARSRCGTSPTCPHPT